jgi:Ras-related protein Ral-A
MGNSSGKHKPTRREKNAEPNVVVLGRNGVGKSALVVQFVQHIFVEKYDSEIEDSYRKMVPRNGSDNVIVTIVDSIQRTLEGASEIGEGFPFLGNDGALFLFDPGDRSSLLWLFEHPLRLLALDADPSTPDRLPMCGVLVATHMDRYQEPIEGEESEPSAGNVREVTQDEAEALAESWNMGYLEISSKTRENVDEVFNLLFDRADQDESMQLGREPSEGTMTKSASKR